MKLRKLIISLLIITAFIANCFVSTYAEDNKDKLILELKTGSSAGKINGVSSRVEKPYINGKTIMIPLGWFTTAIGAEVNSKGNNKYEIVYCDYISEITVGSKDYKSNSEDQRLIAAPVFNNDRIMVPVEFLSKNFPVTVTSDLKKGSVKIVLEDDGALEDLSFLTGGISSPGIGNSYYGWSLNIPAGSRIITNSFKSDKIGITNESRSLYFEVCVEDKKSRTLSELYNDVLYNSVRSSTLDIKAAVPYFQYTRMSEFGEALRVKVFAKGEYFYYVTINCYDSSVTPEKLVSDKYYDNIMNSFSLDYKGNKKGIEDISKVTQGKVSFYNYVSLNSDSKYMPWSVQIPTKWNQLPSNDALSTYLGEDKQHYMKIYMNTLDDGSSLEEHAEKIKRDYDKYFNPEVYSFISSDVTTAAGADAENLIFKLKQGKKSFIINELYFIKNNFVYEISLKLPENEYEKQKDQYIDAINNMTFYDLDHNKYEKDLEKYNNMNLRTRISQQDDPFEYINKTYSWRLNIPGYWTKSGMDYDSSVIFQNPDTSGYIMITAQENTSITKTLTDEEKFDMMQMLSKRYKVVPVKGTKSENGLQMRTYSYRIEDEDMDMYTDVVCYCFDSNKYSYCYLSYIPDLTATETAKQEMEDIWKTFKLTD